MSHAIIIKGPSNSGKTTVILTIFRWIRLYYKPIIIYYAGDAKAQSDIRCDIRIGNLFICLCSAGDYGNPLEDFLDDCKVKNCDIIIVACRAKGITNKVVKNFRIQYGNYETLVKSYIYTSRSPTTISQSKKQALIQIREYLKGLS